MKFKQISIRSLSSASSQGRAMTPWLLVMTICCLVVRQSHAGKGKVPIYMPIPIPIPMPMGPAPPVGGSKFGTPIHNHHYQQQHDDGEPEVKKIYLLQPMPKILPQPQLKGGGFMGPAVQNHIHLPGSMHHGPAKFRSAPKTQQQQHYHNRYQQLSYGHRQPDQVGDLGQIHYAERTAGDVTGGIGGAGSAGGGGDGKSSHEVKVLPIVVIPPIAPMPPIHISSGGSLNQSPRLTPQFNNYVVAGSSHERRKLRQAVGGGHLMNDDEQPSYGGSVGGSVFRDNPARFRPRNRQSRLSSSSSNRYRDYDYPSDSDYESNIASSSRSGDYYQPYHSSPISPSSGGRMGRRHYQQQQQQSKSLRRNPIGQGEHRHNSIRDIVEHQAASTQFDDDPVEIRGGQFGDEYRSTTSGESLDLVQDVDQQLHRTQLNQRQQQLTSSSGRQPTAEITLDELALQLSDKIPGGGRLQQQQQQDLNSLYYDRSESSLEQPLQLYANNQRMGTRLLGGSVGGYNGSSMIGRSASPTRIGNRPYSDERDLFDDDEWRFDSIKSVIHSVANETTMTKQPNFSNSPRATVNGAIELKSHNSILSKENTNSTTTLSTLALN